jgi:hypothetical protein
MSQRQFTFAPLNLIRSALCPLDFTAMRLRDHPAYEHVRADSALGELEVGESLHYPRQFTYTDQNNHRRTGTQIVTAPFGLAPVDFDLFLGLFTYLKRLPEIPADRKLYLTADFIGKLIGLPTTCPEDYNRIRSRIFRFSYLKYTNSAVWNSVTRSYTDIANFEFFSIKSMSRMMESRRPVVLQLSDDFAEIVQRAPALCFDRELYRSLSPAMRRLYLIANRDGWNQRDSSIFAADDFTIHQLGYAATPQLRRHRLHMLRRQLKEAAERDRIRPYKPWNGYFTTPDHAPLRGRLALRWSRGPLLRTKAGRAGSRPGPSLHDDALYAQTMRLRDQAGRPLIESVYRNLLAKFGRDRLQKHIAVILAQKEHHPGSFKKSEVATFVDRVQNDYADPDWFTDLNRAERLAAFDQIAPSATSENLYRSISQST